MSWPQVKLESIFDIARGGSPRPIDDYITDADDGLNWISIKDASNSNKYIEATKLKIKPEGLSKTRQVKPGDFLLTNSMSFGRPYIMKTTGCIHDGWLVLSGDPEKVDSDYFYHLLGSDLLKRRFSALAAGAVVKNLNIDLVKGVEIPLPPLPEQKRIAAILDKADAIRRKRQQAIQLADDFLRAVFLDMFGDPVTNPKGWPLKRFGDVGTWSSGGTPSRTVSDFFEGEINWYSAGELNSRYLDGSVEKISESAIKNSAAKIFKKDSLLVGMYDTAAMKISILKEDSSCNQACANVECNELASVEWLYSYIDYAKDSYLSRRRGVRQKNLNLGMIRDFLLPLPPRDLQDEFVSFVSAVFGMKKKQDECKDFPVFESLSLKAFSGQL